MSISFLAFQIKAPECTLFSFWILSWTPVPITLGQIRLDSINITGIGILQMCVRTCVWSVCTWQEQAAGVSSFHHAGR